MGILPGFSYRKPYRPWEACSHVHYYRSAYLLARSDSGKRLSYGSAIMVPISFVSDLDDFLPSLATPPFLYASIWTFVKAW